MLTDMPQANTYYLNPLKVINSEDSRMFESDKIMEVGGIGVMNEVGTLIEDNQIVLVMGITNDKCLVFVNINDVECADIITRARMNYDVKTGRLLSAPQDSKVVE